LERIIERSRRVSDIVAQVVAASEEQAHSMSEVSSHVEGITSIAAHAATTTRETASRIDALETMTQMLQDLVRQFNTEAALADTSTPHLSANKQRLITR
jgi:methyl-accepting chemotaxis protein